MTTRPPNPADPTADLALLEEKRRAMRRRALECLAEADRLDALYAAVTRHDPAGGPPRDFNSCPDGDPG